MDFIKQLKKTGKKDIIDSDMPFVNEKRRAKGLAKSIEGKTYQQWADELGCPLSTIYTRVYNGKHPNPALNDDCGRRGRTLGSGAARFKGLTHLQWAAKLEVSVWTIRNRMKANGTPYSG